MAADWIALRHDLQDDPAVVAIAAALGLDAYAVIGRLHKFWSWADRHTVNGNARGVTGEWVDRFVEADGFAKALESAGWLSVTSTGVSVPKFNRHMGQSAKRRALTAQRVKRHREKKRNAPGVSKALPQDSTVQDSNRKEDKKRAREPDPLCWSLEGGWQGITDADRAEWGQAYSACDLGRELAAMSVWLRANPDKARKRNWPRFIVNWLARSQEHGGSNAKARPRASAPLKEPVEVRVLNA